MSGFKHLSINQLIHMTDAQSNVQIVDIRDAASFQAGNIANSFNLNNENIATWIAEADMDAPLVVVCYHGVSSQGAASYLAEQGFDEVYSLDGGFTAWSSAHA